LDWGLKNRLSRIIKPEEKAEKYKTLEPYISIYTEFKVDPQNETNYEKLKAELDNIKKVFLNTAKDEETREIILKHFIRV